MKNIISIICPLLAGALMFLSAKPVYPLNSQYHSVPSGAVFGKDNRTEPWNTSEARKKLSESTVAIVESRLLSVDVNSLQKPTIASGSGALIGDDLILTAGHMFPPSKYGLPCKDYSFVFGYTAQKDGTFLGQFPKEDIYQCKEILVLLTQLAVRPNIFCIKDNCKSLPPLENGGDYAIVKLDRKVENRMPLAVSRTPVKPGNELFMIGYPLGEPLKITDTGSVVSIEKGYFKHTLDAFTGNSGSPIFDASALTIVGVATRACIGCDYLPETAKYNDATPSVRFEKWAPFTQLEAEIDTILARKATRKF